MKNDLEEVRAILNALHDGEFGRKKTWERIADELELTKGTVYRVAVQGHDPKDNLIRVKLGLSATQEIPVCGFCGVVHTRPCRKRRSKKHHDSFKDLFATPVEMLKNDLENREEV